MPTTDSSSVPLFLHVPSTGGLTIRRNLIEPNCSDRLAGVQRLPGHFQSFRIFRKEKKQPACLFGHIEYGIHLALPFPVTYFTMLREPIRRAISYYYFAKESDSSEFQTTSDFPLANTLDLVSFYSQLKRDNLQTRYFSGVWHRGFRSCNRILLDLAKNNLSKRFAVIGITERFSESQQLFQQHFGWPKLVEHGKLLARKKYTHTEDTIPPEDRTALENIHKFDIELYRFAKELFAEQLQQYDIR